MPKIHITRHKTINAPIEAVYKAVANMDEWPAWSPWLIMEPDAKVTVSDDKTSYSWKGSRVGEGRMALTDTQAPTTAQYDLTFLTPYKSHAKVGMDLKSVDGGTQITWSMDSALPFFMFFMKKMMETFVGMDYERGLNLLKDYVEDGDVHSALNFIGESDYAGGNYIGVERKCSVDEMPNFMSQGFERLAAFAVQDGLDPAAMFSIYHKFDLIKGLCHFTVAVPCAEAPTGLALGFITASQPPTRIYSLEHVGPYSHLGNGWSAVHALIRSKDIRPVKSYHPFETYLNSPSDTAPNDLITRINFAVK